MLCGAGRSSDIDQLDGAGHVRVGRLQDKDRNFWIDVPVQERMSLSPALYALDMDVSWHRVP